MLLEKLTKKKTPSVYYLRLTYGTKFVSNQADISLCESVNGLRDVK